MDIYSYAGFAFFLTAIISLGTVGLILMINSLMNWVVQQAKYKSQAERQGVKLVDETRLVDSVLEVYRRCFHA
jgi:uncharacterized membrane protein